MAKAAKNPSTWRIIEFAKKGRYLGTVRAADAKSAIKVAIKEFGIDDPHRQRGGSWRSPRCDLHSLWT